MFDQLKIGSGTSFKLSYEDFDASLAERAVKAPEKKEIKETVPFSNQTYDFSKINGDLYWKERELECVFEIIADSPEELEEKKTAFSNWIMNVFNEEIHDPFDPEYHYVGTFYDMEYDDEEHMEKTKATVTFKVFPYKVANEVTNYVFEVSAAMPKYVTLRNDSGHRVIPTVTTDVPVTILNAGESFDFPVGETFYSLFTLDRGDNLLTVTNTLGEDPFVVELTYDPYMYSGAMTPISKVTHGELTLYKTCTPNEDKTFTLSEPYSTAFWNSLDAVSLEELVVGCWFDNYGKPSKVEYVDSGLMSSRNYEISIGYKPGTVKVTFYREVF